MLNGRQCLHGIRCWSAVVLLMMCQVKWSQSLQSLGKLNKTLQQVQHCQDGGNLIEEIDQLLFPPSDYKRDNDEAFNPANMFRMNGCTPEFLSSENVLVIHGSTCNDVPVKIDKMENITTKVSIKLTNIKTFDNTSFESWLGVKHLEISRNDHLETLSEDAFNGLHHLEKLSLSDNRKLSAMHPDAFRSLANLKELYLIRNSFKSISDMTKTLKPSFVPRILLIDMSGNPVAAISRNDFATLSESKVNQLILKQLSLADIGPETFNDLKSLSKLEIGSSKPAQNYVDLLNSLNENKNLSAISLLNFDMFDSTETIVKTLTHYSYQTVILRGARINTLEINKTIRVEKLEHIELSDSTVPLFPSALFNSSIFPYVRKMILRKNRFHSVPSGIPRSSVKVIDLSGNKLIGLTNRSFYFAPKLEVLVLSDASLKQIDDGAFADNKNLIFLDLSLNNFSESSKKFNKEIFSGLSGLQALDLSSCKIREFGDKDIFKSLKNLQLLSLRSNFIKELDLELFKPLTCLRKLDLRTNSFLYLNPSLFESRQLQDVGLFSEIHKVDAKFMNFIHLLQSGERDANNGNCTRVEVITVNSRSQVLNVEFKPKSTLRKDHRAVCRLISTNGNSDPTITPQDNSTYSSTPDDRLEFVYILLKPGYAYDSLSYNMISLLRFLYVLTFYLIILCVITLIALKLVKCATKFKKRPLLAYEGKSDSAGIENKAFTIPYQKMNEEKVPQ